MSMLVVYFSRLKAELTRSYGFLKRINLRFCTDAKLLLLLHNFLGVPDKYWRHNLILLTKETCCVIVLFLFYKCKKWYKILIRKKNSLFTVHLVLQISLSWKLGKFEIIVNHCRDNIKEDKAFHLKFSCLWKYDFILFWKFLNPNKFKQN